MPTLEFVCELQASLERVWAFHNTIDTLFKLTPPDKHACLLDPPAPMRAGVVYRIQVKQFGVIPITMHSIIRDYTPPSGFVDIQAPGKGPFKAWTHQHKFEALAPDRTRLTDTVTYEMPFGPLGTVANALFVRHDIEKMFAFRHDVTRRELENKQTDSAQKIQNAS